jgi:hypothetical protein
MSASGPQDVYRFGVERTVRIIVTTGNDVTGHRIGEFLGVVRGVVVRSSTIGQGFMARRAGVEDGPRPMGGGPALLDTTGSARPTTAAAEQARRCLARSRRVR